MNWNCILYFYFENSKFTKNAKIQLLENIFDIYTNNIINYKRNLLNRSYFYR